MYPKLHWRQQEYRTSAVPFSDFWQCGSDTHDNFGDAAYTPSEQLMEKLVDLSGVQLPTWARLHLHSGRGPQLLGMLSERLSMRQRE